MYQPTEAPARRESAIEAAVPGSQRRPVEGGYEAQRAALSPLAGTDFDAAATTAQIRGSTLESLDYNMVVVGPRQGRDPEARGGFLPYTSPSSWNHQEILNNATQLDAYAESENDGQRCFDQSFLAVFVTRGPIYVAALAAQTRDRLGAMAADSEPCEAQQVMERHYERLDGLEAPLCLEGGTYRHLAIIASALHVLERPNSPGVGSTRESMNRLAELGDDTAGSFSMTEVQEGEELRDVDDMVHLLTHVPDGTHYLVGVRISNTMRNASDGNERSVNHAVTVGRDANGPYLYDPMPREGDQMMRWSSHRDDILDYAQNPWQIRSLIRL